jgi:hypothetical protein
LNYLRYSNQKIQNIMKKGVLFGLAALAVGVVVLTLGKKEKSSNNPKPSLYK